MRTRQARSTPAQSADEIRNILVVSDLHCGSVFGMLPPGFETVAGHEVGQNPGQAYLWKCWSHLVEAVRGLPISAVVVNGDSLDGEQRKSRGDELCLIRKEDQRAAAQSCLAPLKKATFGAVWYFISGTPYHEIGEQVEILAASLGGQRVKGPGPGKLTKRSMDLDVGGVVLNFSHGISVSSGFYRATAVDREGVWSALAGKEGKLPKADCVIRSHAHYFVRVEHYSKHILITPCWQLQTGYMAKNSAYRMLPDIGAVLIRADLSAKARGEDPIHVRKWLYDLPKFEVTRL